MVERALVEYVEAIESHLSRLRGVDHVLSPPDFALARSWQAAGVSLAEVLAAIDEAAERGPLSSLRGCRKRVEAGAGRDPARRRSG